MQTQTKQWVAVLVTFEDGTILSDAILGLSDSDALFNATWNWPAAIHVEVL